MMLGMQHLERHQCSLHSLCVAASSWLLSSHKLVCKFSGRQISTFVSCSLRVLSRLQWVPFMQSWTLDLVFILSFWEDCLHLATVVHVHMPRVWTYFPLHWDMFILPSHCDNWIQSDAIRNSIPDSQNISAETQLRLKHFSFVFFMFATFGTGTACFGASSGPIDSRPRSIEYDAQLHSGLVTVQPETKRLTSCLKTAKLFPTMVAAAQATREWIQLRILGESGTVI